MDIQNNVLLIEGKIYDRSSLDITTVGQVILLFFIPVGM